ncbi:MAG: class I SAM-dependent methyltransferase [Clostridia bacterium]|nr:class I SAM-dependent methyltransferase [Clostridia bacterium]
MDKKEVAAFFDRWAADWDADMIRDDRKIGQILDAACVGEGCSVLDVACGTGVLFPDYLARNAAHVTGIDLSAEMARIAADKASDPRIEVICGDVETTCFDRLYDCCVVYNAFPHFVDPKRVLGRLSALLAPGGVLCVAHGMSLEALERHHQRARGVSRTMLAPNELCALLPPGMEVLTAVADDEKYIVAARRA